MAKALSTAAAGLAVVVSLAAGTPALAQSTFRCGDVSGDGLVNTTDSRLIQLFVIGSISEEDLNGGVEACDVNNDGSCNTSDSRLIQRIAVSQIPESSLYCGPEIFVTAELFDPTEIVSQAVADQICSDAASGAGLFAGSGGWRAVFGPSSQVAGPFTYNSSHWMVTGLLLPPVLSELGGPGGLHFLGPTAGGAEAAVTEVEQIPSEGFISYTDVFLQLDPARVLCMSVAP